MNISKAEKDRVADLIREHSAHVVHCALITSITNFEKCCESPIEIAFGVAFQFAATTLNLCNIPPWELKPQFRWENYRIDFAIFTDLPFPIFIECDGHDFHERTKEQAARDREKDRRIQAAGISILRFTGSQIHANPIKCALEVYMFILDRLKRSRDKATTIHGHINCEAEKLEETRV